MTEQELLDTLITDTRNRLSLAHLLHWRTAHFRPAMLQSGGYRTAVSGDGKGFPDLVFARVPRVVTMELKVRGNKLSDDQADWNNVLQDCRTFEHYIFYDDQLDVLAEVLK